MTRAILVILAFLGVSLLAQDPDSNLLRSLTKAVQQLPVDRVELKTNPPMTFEGISAVTTDSQGNIYVIHRPADGDPVVVLDPKGRVLRSWGKGMFKIPHGIRVDPAGNVWTVDANTSMVYKFTPSGQKLLEFQWGETEWRRDVLNPPERFENGAIRVPERPGLGIELNDNVVRAHLM